MTIEYQLSDKILFVKIIGIWTKKNAYEALEKAKVEVDKHGLKLILLDLTLFSFPDAEMTRFHSGVKLAETFKHKYKISAFDKKEKIDHFGENAAVNRGANFKVFFTKEDALNWLLL